MTDRENIAQMRVIADAYEKLPGGRTCDPSAERSYDAVRREVIEQYNALPVIVERWEREGQPYANSREMFTDVAVNGRLYVFKGGEEHPFFSRDENVMFRAVHDFHGHFLGRFQFGPLGELNAWRAQCRMFSEAAKPAMTAETLGQNCWFNFGPFRHLPPHERPFAEQKASLLPEELWNPLLVGEAEDRRGPCYPAAHGRTLCPPRRVRQGLHPGGDAAGIESTC